MDQRSWPWKKKSSEKSLNRDALQSSNQAEQDEKVPKYVQISPERYSHLNESEKQVEILNAKIKILNEKVASAQSEMNTKDTLVKQHAKVAEEAVSGWEQAEAEASALKLQLETVTLSKLAAEERVAHLDGALKECMKQVRTVKEEGEQKLHDIVFAKTKHWEKIRDELEAKLVEFEQDLIRAGAENDALSRSLEEQANLLLKVNKEKAQAEAQIEVLKSTIQSGEKEINALKYEFHVVSKELDIRNEEKNMSVRSADVSTKQHTEDVKKISKLEAECQRLRGLVRKKLPGPAALAQMKMEVDSWGRDPGDNRLRRSPSRSSTLQYPMSPFPDYARENLQNMQKENELLTVRLLSMDEENKMLKEVLSKCNHELQASQNVCAKTSGKLRSMELHMLSANLYKSPTNSYVDTSTSSQKGSNPPSLTSMSEGGVDDARSCEESWANTLVSELSHNKKDKGGRHILTEKPNHMGLMDDFLEMERLACLSSEAQECEGIVENKVGKVGATISPVTKKESYKNSSPALQSPGSPFISNHLIANSPLSKLHLRISALFSSQSPQNNVVEVLDGIKNILRDIEHEVESVNVNKLQHDDMFEVTGNGSSTKEAKPLGLMDHRLTNAILKIHAFVKLLIRQASELQGTSYYNVASQKIEQFSTLVDEVLSDGNHLMEIVIALSEVLLESGEFKLTLLRETANEVESNNADCVDKVTLLEKKVHHEPSQNSVSGACSLMPHSSSDLDFEGPSPSDTFDVETVQICAPEEYEKLKLEKKNLEMELTKCNEMIKSTHLKFSEMEKNLEDLTSKLSACEKSNSLAETQLKCMAESYKTLESQKVKLEEEIRVLQTKIDTLSADLTEERRSHQEDIAKYRDLEEMERYEKSSFFEAEDSDIKLKKEKEIAAAAEKLAECQETILLLGRQLQTLRPPSESLSSSLNTQQVVQFLEDQAGPAQSVHSKKPSGQFDADYTFLSASGTGNVSPLSGYNPHKSPSNAAGSPYFTLPGSSKHPKHRSRSSSSSFSNQLPEKQGRGFSMLFSKGKSDR